MGEGEHLPYRAEIFDYVLMMTVICFLEDPRAVLYEIFRVLVKSGVLIPGFNRERRGDCHAVLAGEGKKGRFLRLARFLTVDEAARFFEDAGYTGIPVIKRTRGFCMMKGHKR